MVKKHNKKPNQGTEKREMLAKCPTGIRGLDELTEGGIPKGSPTLVCGPAGTGKTLLGIEFIIRGATQHQEPGVYISFEEPTEKIARNIRILGEDWDRLIRKKLIVLDHIITDATGDVVVGDFDLEGLFVRLNAAISRIDAKRVVIDGLETLFTAFKNQELVRKELARLFRWLDARGVTSIVTAEKGEGSLTRRGFEEYLADCVIVLDQRITDQLSTRRLRVLKYRGAPTSTDEFPFFIDEDGICVLPLTTLSLNHDASNARIPTGIDALDEMFGGQGFYRGSSILVSGTAGTGKSSIASTFVSATCERGEKALYFAFEESEKQICRNMRSIGLDLQRWVSKGTLSFQTFRPTVFGLEAHLANIHRIIRQQNPTVVVIDPITNFSPLGTPSEVKNMLMRLIDFLKTRAITALFTSLTEGGSALEQSSVGVSSLIDTWILVRDIEMAGERNRGLYILKSRGMAHSNQIREFVITSKGIGLIPAYVGPDGNVFIGAARVARETEEAAAAVVWPDIEEKQNAFRLQRQKALDSEIAALRARYEAEDQQIESELLKTQRREQQAARRAQQMYRNTSSNGSPNN